MATIHPTAIIDPQAQLGADVEIGPYCVIGPDVTIGSGTCLKAHVVVDGWTVLGEGCTVYPFASLGAQTQDLKYQGGRPGLTIGDRTTLREFVTVNAATDDGDLTRVGSGCHVMAYAHIAHDCVVGDGVIIANCGTLAGHVVIEDQAILGGLSGIHQFVRIGRMSIIGGCSKVTQDVPPFMLADGHPLQVRGLNRVGLQRRGMSRDAQRLLKASFRIMYRCGLSTRQAVERIENEIEPVDEIQQLLAFVNGSERGVTR